MPVPAQVCEPLANSPSNLAISDQFAENEELRTSSGERRIVRERRAIHGEAAASSVSKAALRSEALRGHWPVTLKCKATRPLSESMT